MHRRVTTEAGLSRYTRHIAVDPDLLAQVRAAAAQVAELDCQAEKAKAEHRRLVRHLHLAGASMREIADALGISHQRVHQLVEGAGGARRWRRRAGSGGSLACSFCGRSKAESRSLVAGPGAYICDRCVPAALEVVATRAAVRGSGAALRPVGEGAPEPCSFCGKTRGLVDGLVAGPSSLICADCLELCQEIMAQELQQ